MPRSFPLTLALLAEHRSGVQVCLHASALGRSFAFSRQPPRSSRWGERYSRRGEPLGFGELPVKASDPEEAAGPTCGACKGTGDCAQCSGVGCTVCDSSGDCTVCDGQGTIEPASAKPDDDDDDEQDSSSAPGEDAAAPFVGVVRVEGLLQSEAGGFLCGGDGYQGQRGILARVRAAVAQGPVAMVLHVLSPGGDSLGLGEAAAELAQLREASGIPWCVYALEACSAAYYLSVAAASPGGLFVSQSSDVGCVGTWTRHFDHSAANAKEGVVVTYVEDPVGKTAGNPDQPLSDEALARMQRDVKETTDRFVATVAAYRPAVTDARTLRGDTRRGQAAVDQGLADATASGLADVCAVAWQRGLLARAIASSPLLTGGSALTSSAGAPPPAPAPETPAMPYSAAVLAAAGVAAGASDATLEAALLPRLTLAAAVLATLGEADPVRARGILGAKLERAAKADQLELQLRERSAAGDAAKREKLWEDAVRDRRVQLAQAFAREDGPAGADGKPTVRRVYAKWAVAQNAAYPELPAFEAWITSRVPEPGTAAADPSTALADLAEQRVGGPGVRLSKRDLERAKRAGVEPELLAQVVARQGRGADLATEREGV